MKKPMNPVFKDDPRKKKPESNEEVPLEPCLHCGEEVKDGYYSRHQDRGTCSKECMLEQDKKPKFPGFSEEEFFARMNERLDCDH